VVISGKKKRIYNFFHMRLVVSRQNALSYSCNHNIHGFRDDFRLVPIFYLEIFNFFSFFFVKFKVCVSFFSKTAQNFQHPLQTTAGGKLCCRCCSVDGRKGKGPAHVNEYNAILLDIILPHQDGWTTCMNLRRANVLTPILMLTVRDDYDER
jgi:CheY-like chemotaxis protein